MTDGKPKVLVVDDNDVNRTLLRDVLHLKGYEVMEAKDGSEGVRMARAHMPVLILMDVQMPVMDGMAATKMLKADPGTKEIKIISLTAYAVNVEEQEFMKTGFDDYLSKPLSIHTLIEKVKQFAGEGQP